MKKSKKKAITTIALACVTLLLIGGYYLLVAHNKEKAQKEQEEASKTDPGITIYEHEAADVSSVSVESEKLEMKFNQVDDHWEIEKRDGFPLDEDLVDSMAKYAAGLKMESIVTEKPDNLTDYGLDTPYMTVTADLSDGSQQTVYIGDNSIAGGGYYAKLPDSDTVYILGNASVSSFNKTEEELFKKPELYSTDTSGYLEVQAVSPEGKGIHLAYMGENSSDLSNGIYPWQLVTDGQETINADSDKISDYMTKISGLTSYTGVDYGRDKLADYGLLDNTGLLYVKYKEDDEEHEFTLDIGNKDEDGNYYVCIHGTDVIYSLSGSLLDEVFAYTTEDIESKMFNLINIELVSSIQTTMGQTKHEFLIKHADDSDDDIFYRDEKQYNDSSVFKKTYQAMIGVTFDKHLPEDTKVSGDPVLTMEFKLLDGKSFISSYYAYTDEEYAVAVNGKIKYSCQKTSIDDLITTLNTENTSE